MAYTRTDSSYAFDPADYLRLKDAWMAGKAFVEVRNFHGNELIIKLATIEAISLHTAESIAAQRAEDKADKMDDSFTGAE